MFGNISTNNLLEYQFKSLQHWQDHVRQTNIAHYVQDILLWLTQTQYNDKAAAHLKRLTSIEKEQINNYSQGRLMVDVVFKSSKAAENSEFDIFYVTSSRNTAMQYIVKLIEYQCTCANYYTTCRPCKHVYACAYFITMLCKWSWISRCAYSMLHCINLFIFDKTAFS